MHSVKYPRAVCGLSAGTVQAHGKPFAHLRIPLASIQGYAELIENGMAEGEDAKRFAGEIGRSSKRLLALINDILRLSELDVQEDLECEAVDFPAPAPFAPQNKL